MTEKRKVKIRQDDIPETIDSILEEHFWLQSLDTMTTYERLHDDHDGSFEGVLNVMFSQDGDASLWIEPMPGPALRFRMPGVGGGLSRRTRVALLILARAMQLDKEKPLR